MTDAIGPVTQIKTSHYGPMPTAAIGQNHIKTQVWSLTTYPDGSTVTKIEHYTITLYDRHARAIEYNRPNQIDLRA